MCHVSAATVTVYSDCKEAFNQGKITSGVYTIQPGNLPPFDVRES